MKVVTAFRPFAPESGAHQALGPFDWPGAVRMLRASVRAACACETVLLTEEDAAVEDPVTVRVRTGETRLMLWILAASLAFLESDAFNDDTAFISPDTLVFADLRSYFRADLGVIVRSAPKYIARPLLNGVQFWRVGARARLVEFYADALARARRLAEPLLRWGADTRPLIELLAPITSGPSRRGLLHVYGFEAITTFRTIAGADIARMERGRGVDWPTVPIVDFKYLRKRHMRAYFEATIGRRQQVCA